MSALHHLPIDPYSDDVLTDPTVFHRRLREIGPAARVDQSEGYDIVAVGRDRDLRTVLESPHLFVNSLGSGVLDLRHDEPFREPGVLQETDPPAHTAARTVMTDVISPRTVRRMRAAFQHAADQIVDDLIERGTFDAQTQLAEAFPLQVIPDLVMGARTQGRENLLRYSTFIFESMGPRTPRAKRVLDALGDITPIREWIAESCGRDNVAPDTMGAALWAAAAAGHITDAQAANMVRSLLGAGIDTTIHSLAITVHLLATHPDQWAKLAAAPERAKFAYDEALRYDSVVRQIYRTPAADTDIDGVPVAEGQKLMLVLGAANHDPDRWGPDADTYDIDRQTGGHLSLGRGIHGCVGAPIARLEADVLLSTFARRVRTIEPADEPERLLNNTLRGFVRLPVRITAA
jgi:cytochrome P450